MLLLSCKQKQHAGSLQSVCFCFQKLCERECEREKQLSVLCPHRDMGKKGGKGKKQFDDGSDEDMDEDEDDDGGLSDEEVDFGDDEDDDLAAEFRREMEGLGKEEDNDDEDDDEDEDFSGGKKFESSCNLLLFCVCCLPLLNLRIKLFSVGCGGEDKRKDKKCLRPMYLFSCFITVFPG